MCIRSAATTLWSKVISSNDMQNNVLIIWVIANFRDFIMVLKIIKLTTAFFFFLD